MPRGLFTEDIASALSIYGQNNNHSNSFNFYKKLSWGGLTSTDSFDILYPPLIDPTLGPILGNFNFERFDINYTIVAEQNNETQVLNLNGNTYTYEAKGNTPNKSAPCD